MVERATRAKDRVANGGGQYFAAPIDDVSFIHSGCHLLDLALGGGWAENHVHNIVGDKSTGKTLLAIESCSNFALKYKKGKIRYRECESAFSNEYARAIGMPVDRVDFGADPVDTVEDLFEDLTKIAEGSRGPELCIVDSLDALSDRAEMGRNLDEGTYGTGKARMMSQLFRRLVRVMAKKQVTLLIISQVRSAIGVTFGDKTTRSGGRALDFYSSTIPYLSHLGTISKTVLNQRRPVAIRVRVRVKKNKIAFQGRDAEFKVRFGHGIDDLDASVQWLDVCKRLKSELGVTDKPEAFVSQVSKLPDAEYYAELARVNEAVTRVWYEIERGLIPARRKYDHAALETA
jgi:recombination protein RecA